MRITNCVALGKVATSLREVPGPGSIRSDKLNALRDWEGVALCEEGKVRGKREWWGLG